MATIPVDPNLRAPARELTALEKLEALGQQLKRQFQQEVGSLSQPRAATDILNRGMVAGLVGAPVDLLNLPIATLVPGRASEAPVGGSEWLGRQMERAGLVTPTRRPIAEIAASIVSPLSAFKGAEMVGRAAKAASPTEIQKYVRSAQQSGGALPGTAVVKPKGGNWQTGNIEQATSKLEQGDYRIGTRAALAAHKAEYPPDVLASIKREEGLDRYQELMLERQDMEWNLPVNEWIDQKLNRYIRNEMGTPEDPIRRLAEEKGVTHFLEPEKFISQNSAVTPQIAGARQAAGMSPEGMAKDPLGRAWENAADSVITTSKASDFPGDPGLSKVAPDAPVYGVDPEIATKLGFDNLIDELRTMVRPDYVSGQNLPKKLRWTPKQIEKASVEQVVERVDQINKWRKAEDAKYAAADFRNKATTVLKEYPDTGFKWVEITKPKYVPVTKETLPKEFQIESRPLPDGRVEYEVMPTVENRTEAVGQNYMEHKNKSKYRVTEGPALNEQQALDNFNAYYEKNYLPSELTAALEYEGGKMSHSAGAPDQGHGRQIMYGHERLFSLRDADDNPRVTIEVNPEGVLGRDRPYIAQIKGKGNTKPNEKYLPMVQDFIRSGLVDQGKGWGDIKGVEHTGLFQINNTFWFPEEMRDDLGAAIKAGLTSRHKWYNEQDLQDFLAKGREIRLGTSGTPPEPRAAGGSVKVEDPVKAEHVQKFAQGGSVSIPVDPNVRAPARELTWQEKLQALAQQMKQQFEKERSSLSQPRATTDVLNRGMVAGLVGAPVDLMNLPIQALAPKSAAQAPVGGSEWIGQQMEKLGLVTPTRRPMMELGASVVSPLSAFKGAEMVGRAAKAASPTEIQKYVRSAQQAQGALPGTAAVKPKGGNWAESVLPDHSPIQDAVNSLKWAPEDSDATANAAVEKWADRRLTTYIRNEMATPDDPIRKLMEEKGISHIPDREMFLEANAWVPDDVKDLRVSSGMPAEGVALSKFEAEGLPSDKADNVRFAEAWENATDSAINIEPASQMQQVTDAPWFKKLDPNTPIYDIDSSAVAENMGFDHLLNELRNAARPDSKLPPELRWTPKQLEKVTIEQAVERVDEINKWRDAEAAKEAAAAARNPATFLFKDYPEQGMKWVQIKTPEFTPETLPQGFKLEQWDYKGQPVWSVVDEKGVTHNDAAATPEEAVKRFSSSKVASDILDKALGNEGQIMKHSAGNKGPLIREGRSEIYSLRDKNDVSYVTIEVRPGKPWNERSGIFYDNPELENPWREFHTAMLGNGGASPNIKKFPEWLSQNRPEIFQKYASVFEPSPPKIIQIKGKANTRPKAEYQPFVKDFVQSRQWDEILDIENVDLAAGGRVKVEDPVRAEGIQRLAGGGSVKHPAAQGLPDPSMTNFSLYADTVSREMYPTKAENVQRDAARHILASALAAQKMGPGVAEFLGKAYEWKEAPVRTTGHWLGLSEPRPDYPTDIFNNSVGIEIGQKAKTMDELLNMVQQAVNQGTTKQEPGRALLVPDPIKTKYASGGEVKRGKIRVDDPVKLRRAQQLGLK